MEGLGCGWNLIQHNSTNNNDDDDERAHDAASIATITTLWAPSCPPLRGSLRRFLLWSSPLLMMCTINRTMIWPSSLHAVTAFAIGAANQPTAVPLWLRYRTAAAIAIASATFAIAESLAPLAKRKSDYCYTYTCMHVLLIANSSRTSWRENYSRM